MEPHAPNLSVEERRALREYLREQYAGVFTPDAIESHIDDYVGLDFVNQVAPTVARALSPGARVLDVGSGFGSFVLAARELSLDSIGIEIAEPEVAFARRRLKRVRPQDDAQSVYLQGDARALHFPDATFEGMTFLNILEHVEGLDELFRSAARMLKPGGAVFVICPNYAAFRQEPHYHVPWYPFLPRRWATSYLRRCGRDPAYFKRSIVYRTNWGVMRALTAAGFELYDWSAAESMAISIANLRRIVREPMRFARYYNPIRESVVLAARKHAL